MSAKPYRPMQKDLDAYLRFGFLIHDVSRLRRIVVDRALKRVPRPLRNRA